mgnify:CR=1 FL=1
MPETKYHSFNWIAAFWNSTLKCEGYRILAPARGPISIEVNRVCLWTTRWTVPLNISVKFILNHGCQLGYQLWLTLRCIKELFWIIWNRINEYFFIDHLRYLGLGQNFLTFYSRHKYIFPIHCYPKKYYC